MTLGEWVADARAALQTKGFESFKIEAELLAGHALSLDRAELHARLRLQVDPEPMNTLLARRLAEEPLAYILGYREFYGRRFAIDHRVLIPRHETETVVEVVDSMSHRVVYASNRLRIIDLGTGSGCIAITLKLEHPLWLVSGLDHSPEALHVARANGIRLGADVQWLSGDWLDALASHSMDAIVSNPPYVGREESLPNEVRLFEPETALYSEKSGLADYEAILAQSRRVLRKGGFIVLEVGAEQGAAVSGLAVAAGLTHVSVTKDLSGRDRVVSAVAP